MLKPRRPKLHGRDDEERDVRVSIRAAAHRRVLVRKKTLCMDSPRKLSPFSALWEETQQKHRHSIMDSPRKLSPFSALWEETQQKHTYSIMDSPRQLSPFSALWKETQEKLRHSNDSAIASSAFPTSPMLLVHTGDLGWPRELDPVTSVDLLHPRHSPTREEFNSSLFMTSSQVLTTDSHLHSPVSPLATDQHCHCLWRTPATIEHTSEKKPLSPLEGCSRPVIETSCLPGPPAEPNQDLPTPTVTDYCSSLASTQMYGEPSLASYNPDTLSLHQTILSTTDGLTSELQAMQLFTPLREVHNYSSPVRRVSDCPVINSPLEEYLSPSRTLTDKEKVLAICDQRDHISFHDFFTPIMIRTMRKLGEGVFGEVYGCFTPEGESLAVKIMPIEGDDKINDEKQKTFPEIMAELVISKELSGLGTVPENSPFFTRNFVRVYKLGLVKGKYADFLLDAWDEWDEEEESDNDRPDFFGAEQQYIIFAYENAGHALEAFVFHKKGELLGFLTQITAALAVGEQSYQFEHRDMHRGNVLVRRTSDKFMTFCMDSKQYRLPSGGIHVTVIDYTLSRVSQGDCVSYNDLNNLPWLFQGKSPDLQHDTYKAMQNMTGNEWSKFTPQSNAYWLHYLVNKISLKARHKFITRRQIQGVLRPYISKFPTYKSAHDVFMDLFVTFHQPAQQHE